MPATNMFPDGAISTSAGYLRADRPLLALLQTGLSVFALVIIARHCLRRLHIFWHGQGALTQGELAQPNSNWTSGDEKEVQTASHFLSNMKDQTSNLLEGNERSRDSAKAHDNWTTDKESLLRPLASRRRPATPLTPPELSSAVFTIEDAPHRQESFIHQPNPDYLTSTSPIATITTSSTRSGRRSYAKNLPIGNPFPRQELSSDVDTADLTFSPSSYPPSRPLPPPPPTGGPSDDAFSQTRAMGVKGEIISVLNDQGAGWTRHTRVYGGGVCLACAASGGKHGGGFYGATVTPEEMR
ncbi:hypothetical protein HIM_06778 [Hirsutella minnesotensis 3608]|uniref:Uncharacterized protein n=1 Tax=Hirsutella minnesotensis 3608 TaxID=1043627 RepID=A0A0F7ZNK0_9HYPO|nr:hypothetical protein HIM_06778 [Hirsutella minnesotensis 3608]